MEELPPLVLRAIQVARGIGFPLSRDESAGTGSACLPDVGRFLAMLAAGCTGGQAGPHSGGRIGEIGTGAGIGTAWMASAMPPDCTLVTAEIDQIRAAAARELFASDPRVEVMTGDARAALADRGPFDLLFSDGGGLAGDYVAWLRIGGRIVVDDVTPQQLLPPDSPYRANDHKRDFFFKNPQLVSAEVVLPDLRNALLVGTRVA
jgi:predicted O-methyltransferase YrrM